MFLDWYRASSARFTKSSTDSDTLKVETPKLRVILPRFSPVLFFFKSSRSKARRISSANFMAPSKGVSGSRMANSSPPHFADQNDAASNTDVLAETVEAVVRRELVFVNDNVNAYEILINGIRESDTNRTIEIVVLDANRDGIQQVSDILAEQSNLAVMHVIAYGTDGQINLGNNWLNSTTLQQKSDAVAGWGKALAENGESFFMAVMSLPTAMDKAC